MKSKYFKESELTCRHCNAVGIDEDFVAQLDALREACGFPFVITSGYRCPDHPIEKAKSKPGQHTAGNAVDIRAYTASQRYTIVKHALEMGFTGIGIHDSFVHVDTRGTAPVLWLY